MPIPVYEIRVVRGRGNLPHDISVVLPLKQATTDRDPRSIYLEDFIPAGDDRHTKLGVFLDAWGRVEHMLGQLFAKLAQTDQPAAIAIFSGLGMRKVMDVTTSLATLRLSDDQITALTALLERLARLTAKRNTLVHGRWIMEVFIWVSKGQVHVKSQFLREMPPVDRRLWNKIANPINQKARVKHSFTLKRISAAAQDALTLEDDIVAFLQTI